MSRRERVYRTEAIVLRRTDFGEADRLQKGGLAATLLRRPEIGEGRLQRVQLGTARQSLDRRYPAAPARDGQHQTGETGLAVDQHRAIEIRSLPNQRQHD